MMENSEMNTPKGGAPAMARAPPIRSTAVHGIALTTPCISGIVVLRNRSTRLPVAKNMRHFVKPCVTTRRSAPISATGFPSPTPTEINPICSTEE